MQVISYSRLILAQTGRPTLHKFTSRHLATIDWDAWPGTNYMRSNRRVADDWSVVGVVGVGLGSWMNGEGSWYRMTMSALTDSRINWPERLIEEEVTDTKQCRTLQFSPPQSMRVCRFPPSLSIPSSCLCLPLSSWSMPLLTVSLSLFLSSLRISCCSI